MKRLWVLLGGAAITDLGGGLFQLALPWLVYDVSRSAFWLGVVAMTQSVSLWVVPFMGVIVDRYDRRHVLILALAVQGLTAAGLSALAFAHATSIPAIMVAAVLMALGGRLQLISGSAIRRALTPTGARLQFNSWWANVSLLAAYGAPGLAGFLIQWQGVAWTLAVLSLTALPMLAAALWLPALKGERDDRTAIAQVSHSFQVLRRETGLFRYALFFSYWTWAWSGAMAVMVYFYRHTLHFTAGDVGLVGVLGGVIPLALSVFSPALQRRFKSGTILTAGIVVSGIGLIILPSMSGPIMVGGVLGLLDGPISPILAALSTMTQSRIGNELYGRVMSVRMLMTNALSPVAALAAGALAGVMGAGPVIRGFGGLTLAAGLLAPFLAVNRVALDGSHGSTPEPDPTD